MSNVLIEQSTLSNIADAIRAKNGLSNTYTPSQMINAINSLVKTGYNVIDICNRNISGFISGSTSIIGAYAFTGCSNITSISFANCTRISSCAFSSCVKLSSMYLPNVTSIEGSAFYGCKSLTYINFSQITSLFGGTFGYCENLTSVSFPNLQYIQGDFSGCGFSYINLPELISVRGYYAFYYCRNLTSVSLPKLTYLYQYTFYWCPKLAVINLPSCSYVGPYAFQACSVLSLISIPICISISTGAFSNCYNLLSLYLNNVSMVTTLSTSAFNSTPIGGYTTSTGGVYGSVYVPSSLLTSFKTATNWAAISDRIVGV